MAAPRKKAARRRDSWRGPARSPTWTSRSPGTRRRSPACTEPVSLANTRIDFSFTGRASHAAAAPHLGRSALDAMELMNVGVNYMREHMPSDARVHYAVLDAGGIAPNVVQAHAKVRYLIRARNLPELTRLIERVRKIADGAALMTETSVKAQVVSAVSNLMGNTALEKAMHDNLQRLGPPPFDEADRAFARKIQATLSEEDIESLVPPRRHAGERRGAVRRGRPDGCEERADDGFDGRGRRELGGADGAGAWRHLCDRYAGSFLAVDRAGQDAGRAQGNGARGEGDGRHRGGRDCTTRCCWRAPRPITRRRCRARPTCVRCPTTSNRRSKCPPEGEGEKKKGTPLPLREGSSLFFVPVPRSYPDAYGP